VTGQFNRKSQILSTTISLILSMVVCGLLFTKVSPSLPTLDVKHTPPPAFFEGELRAYRDAPFEVAFVLGRAPGCQNADGSLISLIAREALQAGVNPKVLAATVAVESRCDPLAVSSRGAIGLMQIRARAWRTKFDFARVNLFNPSDNVHTGAAIMADLIRRHGLRIGLQHYNGATLGRSACDHCYSAHVLALADGRASRTIKATNNRLPLQSTVEEIFTRKTSGGASLVSRVQMTPTQPGAFSDLE